MAQTYKLLQGRHYEASIRLSGIETLKSNTGIADMLTDGGFSKVRVTGTGNNRTARGQWSKPSQMAEVPAQVIHVKEVEEIKSLG